MFVCFYAMVYHSDKKMLESKLIKTSSSSSNRSKTGQSSSSSSSSSSLSSSKRSKQKKKRKIVVGQRRRRQSSVLLLISFISTSSILILSPITCAVLNNNINTTTSNNNNNLNETSVPRNESYSFKDPRFIYSPADQWIRNDSSSNLAYTNFTHANFSTTFYGSAVYLSGSRKADRSILKIVIDGKETYDVSLNGPNMAKVDEEVLWGVEFWFGNHTFLAYNPGSDPSRPYVAFSSLTITTGQPRNKDPAVESKPLNDGSTSSTNKSRLIRRVIAGLLSSVGFGLLFGFLVYHQRKRSNRKIDRFMQERGESLRRLNKRNTNDSSQDSNNLNVSNEPSFLSPNSTLNSTPGYSSSIGVPILEGNDTDHENGHKGLGLISGSYNKPSHHYHHHYFYENQPSFRRNEVSGEDDDYIFSMEHELSPLSIYEHQPIIDLENQRQYRYDLETQRRLRGGGGGERLELEDEEDLRGMRSEERDLVLGEGEGKDDESLKKKDQGFVDDEEDESEFWRPRRRTEVENSIGSDHIENVTTTVQDDDYNDDDDDDDDGQRMFRRQS